MVSDDGQVGKSVWTTLQKDVSRNSVLLHIGACRQVGPKLFRS